MATNFESTLTVNGVKVNISVRASRIIKSLLQWEPCDDKTAMPAMPEVTALIEKLVSLKAKLGNAELEFYSPKVNGHNYAVKTTIDSFAACPAKVAELAKRCNALDQKIVTLKADLAKLVAERESLTLGAPLVITRERKAESEKTESESTPADKWAALNALL